MTRWAILAAFLVGCSSQKPTLGDAYRATLHLCELYRLSPPEARTAEHDRICADLSDVCTDTPMQTTP